MKITIDRELCCGHARCEDDAPEVFEVRDDGLAYLKMENPGEEFRSQVEAAVRDCPAHALSLEA